MKKEGLMIALGVGKPKGACPHCGADMKGKPELDGDYEDMESSDKESAVMNHARAIAQLLADDEE
jgi:hypothetical protein